MKINAMELLLLDKKVRFGESEKNPVIKEPTIDKDVPQSGLNLLTLKGLNNVVSNPKLAMTLGMNEENLPNIENELNKEANDLTFQGLPQKFNSKNIKYGVDKFYNRLNLKNITAKLMLALATIQGSGAIGTIGAIGGAMGLASCDRDVKVTTSSKTEVHVDNQAILEMYEKMMQIWQQMLDQQKITVEQLKQNQKFLLELINNSKDGNKAMMELVIQLIGLMQTSNSNDKNFYQAIFNFMTESEINQKAIISLLVKNGMKQDEANKVVKKILDEIISGKKSEEEGVKEIINLLGDIKGMLSQIINDLKRYHEEMMKKQEDIKNITEKGLKELIAGDKQANETLSKLAEQNDSLLTINNKQLEELKNLKQAIIEAGISNDANLKEIANKLNVNYADLKDLMISLGNHRSEVDNLNTQAVLAAIEKGSVKLDTGNKLLDKISAQIADLPNQLQNGPVSDETLKQILAMYHEIMAQQGQYTKEMIDKMNVLLEKLDKLQKSVDGIYSKISEQSDIVNKFYSEFIEKFDKSLELLKNFQTKMDVIIKNQGNVQQYLNKTLEEVKNLKIEIQKWENASGGNLDYEKLEQMWKEHDEANYKKYSELINKLGIDKTQIKTIVDLLKSIDAKMNTLQENNSTLNKILVILQNIDWSNPEIQAKLDKIIQLLEDFECNCHCGGNNEGILGELEELTGMKFFNPADVK